MADNGRLFGVRAIVFGAGSGIGEAIARTYTKHGAKVLAIDSRDANLDQLLGSVSGITSLTMPTGEADSAVTAVEAAVREFGGLDAVVNSFAVQPAEPFTDEFQLQPVLTQRLKRVQKNFDAAWPRLRNSPAGRFISIGYLRSAFPRDGNALFARAEDALSEQAREFAEQSGKFGVTVNYIQPGAIMTAESRRVFQNDKALRDHCIQGSAERRLGDPIDIAKVALFLASDDAAFVSGTGIRVDGGRAAG